MDFKVATSKMQNLLGAAAGLPLKQAGLTRQGIEMLFEDANQRVEVLLLPKMYPDGRVIIDAVNDLTILVRVRRSDLTGNAPTTEEEIELPYSTWFGEAFM